MVRGLVGIDVDSLVRIASVLHPVTHPYSNKVLSYLHKVALEEFIEIPLSSRVRKVTNVEATSLSDDGEDSFVLSCIDGFTASDVVGTGSRLINMILDGSVGHRVSDILNRRHSD